MNTFCLIWILCIVEYGMCLPVRIGGIFPSYNTNKNIKQAPLFLKFIQQSTNLTEFEKRREKMSYFDRRLQLAFKFSILSLNSHFPKNRTFTSNVMTYEEGSRKSFFMMKQVCAQLSLGVAAVFTSRRSDVIRSTCSAKQMVHVDVGEDGSEDRFSMSNLEETADSYYTLKMAPSNEVWNLAALDLSRFYEWNKIAVAYCGSLSQVQLLVDFLTKRRGTELTLVYLNPFVTSQLRKGLKVIKERKITQVILHCANNNALTHILEFALRTGALTYKSRYIITGLNAALALEEQSTKFGGLNVTSLSILSSRQSYNLIKQSWIKYLSDHLYKGDHQVGDVFSLYGSLPLYTFTNEVALMYDAVHLYSTALHSVLSSTSIPFNHRSLPCDRRDIWLFGPVLMKALKKSLYRGLTGEISFNHHGQRKNVSLDVVTLTYNGLETIGKWRSEPSISEAQNTYQRRLKMFNSEPNETETVGFLRNRTLRVTIILEEPYVFKVTNGTGEEGKKYSGYCIDLLERLSAELKFNYNVTPVHDDAYGHKQANGEWDGMVGELVNDNADLAVAPLTITYDREKAVRFTTPYMSLGVSILYTTPRVVSPSLFGFLNPLSPIIWVLVFVSYLTVAFIMFCIARLSPYEWKDVSVDGTKLDQVENSFGILDSLWFGIGALMQQGSDISPKSISTRLLAGVWWFFILILISSYTANLAAFLTVTRMETEISSADDLAAQTSIKYGTLKGQATASFFQNSKLPTFSKMWHFMNQTPDVFTSSNEEGINRVLEGNYAYLMESSTLTYIANRNCNLTQVGSLLDTRGYGLATMEPKLRDRLSVAILKLQENGILDELKQKWWTNNVTECPETDTSKTKSLSVANLGGSFVFLSFGASVAMITAVIEFLTHSFINAKKKKRTLRSEVKRGFFTICDCHNRVRRTSFFENSSQVKEDLSVELSSCVCSSCLFKNAAKEETNKHALPTCDIQRISNSNSRSSRYCPEFTTMVETVLSDHLPEESQCNVSFPTECLTSSVSSKEPNFAGAALHRNVLKHPHCSEHILDSDVASSSFSLPECSPSFDSRRKKRDVSRVSRFNSCFDNLSNSHKIRSSTGQSRFRRERSDIRRYRYANSRSFRCVNANKSRESDNLTHAYSVSLQHPGDIDEESSTPQKVTILNFNDMKQTIM